MSKTDAGPDVSFSLEGIRILLVEDNPVNVLVAENMLKKFGCEVVTASDGRQAVELYCRHVFDVILMDCSMPIMDGFEATRKIRKAEAARGANPVHIIALTANAMKEDRERCLEAGMDDFLPKPISMILLEEKLKILEAS